MNDRDLALAALVQTRQRGEPMPATVRVSGAVSDTQRFLESFRFDRREAWPAISELLSEFNSRPLVSEIAGSL
ncbi:hypothetical protein [Bradyrhizobium sp. STM 3809]|uniref:hypothetical protein n=1 Tax=Bradyrhizobium sp. STM 3809 TaxID=551936 RepID=UPI0002408E65|nr:hypothetical protein [Bradyrhizobium sp. STM 3809]CCE01129.1 hypothetical protein BRAS3809_4270003 [Bradyrhizobium sp. STM 3809]